MLPVLVAAVVMLFASQAEGCEGCRCRGGPGFRLPNGKCASWVQHKRYGNGSAYPVGTCDERNGTRCGRNDETDDAAD